MKWEKERERESSRHSPYGRRDSRELTMRADMEERDNRFAPGGGACMCCGRFGHIKPQCPDAHKTCDNCGMTGHLHSQCRHPPSCNACGSLDHVKATCPYKDDTCGLCGKTGHLKVKCHQNPNAGNLPPAGSSGGVGKECYGCGSFDHMKVDCPAKSKTCDLCGKVGHIKAKCHMRASSTVDVRDVRDSRMDTGDRECFGCGSRSHMKADCPAKYKTCDICGKEGHLKAMCRQRDGGDRDASRDGGPHVECYGCGSWDHRKIDCPARNKTCDNCGMVGHLARKCHKR